MLASGAVSLLVLAAACGFDGTGTYLPEPLPPDSSIPAALPPRDASVDVSQADVSDAAMPSREATLADFCAKCAQCVTSSTFSEGFCDPYRGTTFDVAGCTMSGNQGDLERPRVTKAELDSWTCVDFDNNE